MVAGIGRMLHRAVTLECVQDFRRMDQTRQQEVVTKVAVVGAVTLGLTLLAGLISTTFLWAIPLTTILSMGIAFVANTDVPQAPSIQWVSNLIRQFTGQL